MQQTRYEKFEKQATNGASARMPQMASEDKLTTGGLINTTSRASRAGSQRVTRTGRAGPRLANRASDAHRRAGLQHTKLIIPSGPDALATAVNSATPTAHHTHFQHRPWSTRRSANNPRATPTTLTTMVPTAAPAGQDHNMDGAALIPERNANFLSIITFQWIQPLLSKGYRRPLVETDLWALDGSRDSERLSALLMEHYERRTLAARKRRSRPRALLASALSDTFFRQFWSAGLFKLVSDGLAVGSPLVTRALIDYGVRVYSSRHGAGPPPSAGHGYALAVGLFLMQLGSAAFLHQFFYRSMSVGVLARSSLIAAIYKRALVLDGRARKQLSPAQLLAHISTDVARIDFCLGFFHLAWTAPIQFIAIMAILINQIGVSSLAGIGLMIVLLPLQFKAMGLMFSLRMKVMSWTDKRTRKTQEVLGGMKLLKLFGWEAAFERIITGARTQELGLLRSALIVRAGTMALASSLPLLGAVLAFVTYTATGHGAGDPSAIFTSLSLFNLLRMPLLLLPVALGAITDAANAFKRLEKIFVAGVVEGEAEAGAVVDPAMDCAIRVAGASWVWESEAESVPVPEKAEGLTEKAASASTVCEEKQRQQFELAGITLGIPRGSLTAIVGPVGAGKSSLLQALMGEMKQTDGPPARFGGTIGYCAQTAWIQNETIRANVTFGLPFDEGRYKAVLSAACLEADLATLPHGDETMIGERGINLSGGQKQRVNIARALYFSPDIILFDDPLSAVDAHVGNALFERAMRATVAVAGGRAQTRVLVTHSLQYLPKVDDIICIENGRIAERGTFDELNAAGGTFAALYRDFGGGKKEGEGVEVVETERTVVAGRDGDLQKSEEKDVIQKKEGVVVDRDGDAKGATDTANGMQEEERTTGSVGWRVYREYFWAGNGKWMGPILLMSIILQQVGTVLGSYWLVWWQNGKFSGALGEGGYMGVYAGLGVFQTAAGFMLGAASVTIGYYASMNLYGGALKSVLRAPMSFFDTTPLGRVMNRLSKDMDSIDNTLNDSMRLALTTMSAVIGSIVLIGITSQWFLLAVAGTGVVYVLVARYYRPSARDIQRLDNLLRSGLYAHFSESLNGLTTIKAYGMAAQSVAKHCKLLDYENRAYLLTVVNQRWLGIRLDGLGAVLVLVVAIIGVAQAGTLNPSETGLILSYILAISSSFTWMVRQLAEVENNLNSVERVMWYRDQLPQEAPARIPASDPAPSWPTKGAIRAEEIVMCYRPGLPQVLKGLSFEIRAGEKMAVVGRTGAGKSSLMMALFRTAELDSGRLLIDGVDISKVGLDRLRQAISIIPQDAVLFEGTIRTNIDPFGEFEDEKLLTALQRAGFSGKSRGTGKGEVEGRYGLESVVEDEGQNLSVGERSLVSLARALVKDSQIIVLDEATASVDFETDGKIQETIRKEFKDKTVLCIAHRLRSVIHYDQIMVMDAGKLVEVGTALELFDKMNGDGGGQEQDGIFRGMCLAAGIKREDILCGQQ